MELEIPVGVIRKNMASVNMVRERSGVPDYLDNGTGRLTESFECEQSEMCGTRECGVCDDARYDLNRIQAGLPEGLDSKLGQTGWFRQSLQIEEPVDGGTKVQIIGIDSGIVTVNQHVIPESLEDGLRWRRR